jgi:hypothetical protein
MLQYRNPFFNFIIMSIRQYILFAFLFFVMQIQAQPVRQLRPILEFRMPRGEGDNGGTVAISLKNRNYYATIAGKKTYSMAIFNGAGEMISPADLALLYDIRGLWYHPVQKTFYANGFGNIGWIKYTIDEAGIPYDANPIFEGQRQPFPQSVGQFSQKENLVYFLKGSTVVVFDAITGNPMPEKNKLLRIGYNRKNPPPPNQTIDSFSVRTDYNTTTLIYTGLAQSEFGLLNLKTREIELYGAVDGLMSSRLKIPEDIPVRDKLNFAFCNNFYWLYDNSKRSWIGLR